MAILVNPASKTDQWKRDLADELPGEELRWWPEIGDPADIDLVIAWVLPRSAVAELENLEAILTLSAGSEQWLKPGMPNVPIVRLADPAMSAEMAAYALGWVVRHHRRFAECERLQREHRWQVPDGLSTADFRVGILGCGTIGTQIAEAFQMLGYPINAWVRSGREIPDAQVFVGNERLDEFLSASHAVINVLPNTESTRGLLDTDRFGKMPEGSLFVNIGRGTVLASESGLIAALDDGPLEAAVLDVTNPEPPAEDSPLFDHPAVTLTAHLSGETKVVTAARLVAANVERLRAGDEPYPLLDRTLGY